MQMTSRSAFANVFFAQALPLSKEGGTGILQLLALGTVIRKVITCSMNYMKLVILLHSLYWLIHTKDESKHGTAFAFIFAVN